MINDNIVIINYCYYYRQFIVNLLLLLLSTLYCKPIIVSNTGEENSSQCVYACTCVNVYVYVCVRVCVFCEG